MDISGRSISFSQEMAEVCIPILHSTVCSFQYNVSAFYCCRYPFSSREGQALLFKDYLKSPVLAEMTEVSITSVLVQVANCLEFQQIPGVVLRRMDLAVEEALELS